MRHKVFNLSKQPDIILGINLNSLNLLGCKITLRTLRISNAQFTPLGRLAKLKSEFPITWARSLKKLHDCFVKQKAILIIKLVVTKCYTLALCCSLRMWQGSPMRNQPLRWEIERKRRQWSGVGGCCYHHRWCCTLVISLADNTGEAALLNPNSGPLQKVKSNLPDTSVLGSGQTFCFSARQWPRQPARPSSEKLIPYGIAMVRE
jgi:hypothetical protein